MKEIATMECTGGAGKLVKEGRCAMIGGVSIMTLEKDVYLSVDADVANIPNSSERIRVQMHVSY